MANRWLFFLLTTALFWLTAHAVALFCHELAHSFSAAALGWKANPLVLDWGGSSVSNVLLQLEVDENVDYRPIFDSGHAVDAGLIALAGCVLGNLCLSLAFGAWLFAFARRQNRTAVGAFAYWLVVMSVGNLVSYVPLRVFTTHADMHTVALGFGWAPLDVLAYLGPFALVATAWFFASFQPKALAWLHAAHPGVGVVTIVTTSLTVFGFFCLGGISGYGVTSHRLSVAFMAILAPLSICFSLHRCRRLAVAA